MSKSLPFKLLATVDNEYYLILFFVLNKQVYNYIIANMISLAMKRNNLNSI